MQVEVYQIAEGFYGLALFLAAIILARYTRKRVQSLPEEEKSAGKPLYLSSLGVFVLGVASVMEHFRATSMPTIEMLVFYYIVTMIGASFLTTASLMILEKRRLIPFAVVLLAIGIVVAFATMLAGLPEMMIYVIPGIVVDILYAIPAVLFIYLTKTTKRVTSLSLAILLISYPLFVLVIFIANPTLLLFFVMTRLFSASFVIVAFFRPELGISGESIGYGISFAVMSAWISYIISFGLLDPIATLPLTLLAISAIFGLGTSAYTYGRWKISHNPATLALQVFFVLASFGFLFPAFQTLGATTEMWFNYMSLIIGMLSMVVLSISAILALEWKNVTLAPVVISLPIIVYTLINYPMDPDLIPYRGILMGITQLVLTIVPIGLYLTIWWGMRKESVAGRTRPLFLALGVFFLIYGGIFDVTTLIPAIAITIAFILWWLGVTGRADKILGTA